MPGGSLIPQQQDRHFFGILNALCLEMDKTIIHYKKKPNIGGLKLEKKNNDNISIP